MTFLNFGDKKIWLYRSS